MNMKRHLSIGLLSLGMLSFGLTAPALAQSDAVTNAYLYQRDGRLDLAKAEVDKATQHEKTGNKAKTWYYKAIIYKDIATSPLPAYKNLDPNAAETAYLAYQKVIELDKEGEWAPKAQKEMKELWNIAINDGVKKYEVKDYAGALASYDMAARIEPKDTTSVLYASYAAEALQDQAKAKTYYVKLLELGRKKPETYIQLANIAKHVEKNDKEAENYITQGRKEFPNDKNLALEELNMMLTSGKLVEAKTKLEEAIKLDPNNASLYSTLGVLYDSEANSKDKPAAERKTSRDKAIAAYTKALELDPTNSDANFNLGIYYFNQGVDIRKKVNDMNINDYNKTGKKLEAEANTTFMKALPYFQKAYEKVPTDKGIRTSLKKTYTVLNRKEDAAKIPD